MRTALTAQEFYTNRTVVHLMTEILQPRPGESIYDPTCGSAGMLISAIAHLKQHGKEWRNVHAYGQEINQLSSAIGRMNLFLHGVEDFEIANDDTLRHPAFLEAGRLRAFDMVLANPPYSIKQWDRESFASDPYGRNFLGTPRKAVPTTPSSSTSSRAWTRRAVGVPSSFPTACSSAMRSRRCARGS
ncbi:MAG: class I SAM-dependent DNA methyltransferase [Collinsella sp.]